MFFWNIGNHLPQNYSPEGNSHHWYRRENPTSCIGLCKDLRVGVTCIETPVALFYAIHIALVPEKLPHQHGAQPASRWKWMRRNFSWLNLFDNTASIASVILNLIIIIRFQYGHNNMLDGTRSLLFYDILILLKITQRWLWKLLSSGIMCHVVW